MDFQTQFDIDIKNDVPVVRVAGSLDHINSSRFRSTISKLIEAGHKRIVVDMSAVDFMDSGGLSGVVYAIKRLSVIEGRLQLAGLQPRTARKFEVSGLTRLPSVLTFHPSAEEALELP